MDSSTIFEFDDSNLLTGQTLSGKALNCWMRVTSTFPSSGNGAQ